MPQKLLVLGAGGMLGHKLCQLLPEQDYKVYAAVRQKPPGTVFHPAVDIIDKVDVLDDANLHEVFMQTRPDVVINAVGIVKQLDAAHDRYLSVAVNAFLPHRLNKLCEKFGARLIHISTDCVFSGTQGDYCEEDISDAEDLYGKTKYLGETDETQTHAITLRTSIIGHELKTHTHGLLAWALKQQGKTIKGYKKAFFTGFTTNELTNVIDLIIKKFPDLHGLYQVASHRISKYDLLQIINQEYKLNMDIEADNEFSCDRSLNGQRFIAATNYVVPAWESMIKAMHAQEAIK